MGKIATTVLATGKDWSFCDVRCSSGPQDRPFEELHTTTSIALVLKGSFQYRSTHGPELLSPGSLLLGSFGQAFQCRHEYGTGDRCLAFFYLPEFFERAGLTTGFPVHRIPPIKALASLIIQARQRLIFAERMIFEDLPYDFAGAVLRVLGNTPDTTRVPTAADERRVSATLRFIEANLSQPLSLELLAANAKMSEFHFLRVFKQVTNITPHQYVLRSRLREAAFRLRTSSKDVVDISVDTGFRDLSSFNRAFRSEFGLNPTRFRRT